MKGIAVSWAAVLIACAVARAQEGTEAVASRPAAQPAAQPAPAAGGWWDDVFMERDVTLGTVLQNAEAFRGIPISFVVQFRQPGRAEPSYFTRFDPDQWMGFVAWPDEAPLWEKKAYDQDVRHLFVRRGTPEAKRVASAALYDRMALSGIVRDVIKGQPWIEITGVRLLAEKLTEGSLVHLVKGLTFRDHKRFDAAAREFEAADAETLPLEVRIVGMREHAFALLNARDPVAAEEKMLAALALDPANAETSAALTHLRDRARRMPAPASRPVIVLPPPQAEDDEPVTPGPPDPLAERPRRVTRRPAGPRSQDPRQAEPR
jgi:hypothetical protein